MNYLYSKLTPFNNSKKVLVQDQNVSDIIGAMLEAHNKYASEYNKIAKSFEGRSIRSTARNIYDFLKKNVNYVVEPDEKQTIKSPAAILYTGKSTGSDCKNYSLFTAGILDALKRSGFPIDWTFRFASYRLMDRMPHHVFVVINPGTNKEIWVDPVLNGFDYKKQYFYKIDKKPKNMSLIALAGVGASKKRQEKKAARKAAKPAKKAARKEKVKKTLQKIKQTGKAVVKVAATPVRNSFLLLVKINFKNLAGKLKRVYDTNPDKLKTFWSQFGGSWDSLIKNINTGYAKKAIGYIGDATVASAAVTTASPILIKLAKFLKSIGINPEQIGELATQKLQEVASNAVDRLVSENKANEAEDKAELAKTNEELSQGVEETTSGTGLSKNTMLLGGAALVGAYLLFRKK